MARVIELSQFYLPPTCLSTSGMSHTCLYSPAAERHRTFGWYSFPVPLSWPGWLGEILRWFARSKTVTHPTTNRAKRRVTYAQRRYHYVLPPRVGVDVYICLCVVSNHFTGPTRASSALTLLVGRQKEHPVRKK